MEHSSLDNGVCQCKPEFRSACYGAAKFEHGNERYCILHLPSEDKKDNFKKAVQSKFDQDDLMFAGVYFPRDLALFSGFPFSGEANFSSTTFHGVAAFSGTTFKNRANFAGAKFMGTALFSGATFGFDNELEEAAMPQGSKTEAAQFAGAIFKDKALFLGSTCFEGRANFIGTTFEREADFGGVTFKKEVEFYLATFKDRANFSHLKVFTGTAFAFSNATIEKPERISFHTTHLRPSWFVDVDAQKFDFSDVEWFRLPNGDKLKLGDEIEALRSRHIEPPESLRKLTKACRRLTTNAEENLDYPTADEFHYWSMEAQRKEGWSRLGLIATLYWALSGYGERPRRAFWVLVALWLTFAALYLLVQSSPFLVFGAADVWQGIDYTRQAAVYSLSAMARLNPRPQSEVLDWFQTLVTVEGILGPLQLALFLLAVRRKVMR